MIQQVFNGLNLRLCIFFITGTSNPFFLYLEFCRIMLHRVFSGRLRPYLLLLRGVISDKIHTGQQNKAVIVSFHRIVQLIMMIIYFDVML